MSHHVPGLPWTDEQWGEANKVVQDAARRARVASSFLPLVGPLPDGQAAVPACRMGEQDLALPDGGEAARRLAVDDGEYLRLTTIACHVYLTTQQASDPELNSAKQMLARAADIVGRLEDTIIFRGQNDAGLPAGVPPGLPQIYEVGGGKENAGLLDANCVCTVDRSDTERFGENLLSAAVAAVQSLERRGHYGPFACILGHDLYRAANRPNRESLVLPSDRIVPFLDGGPLRRSSVIPADQGVVVALAGSPIDLVVAKDIHVRFLQVTLEPHYVLRVSERMVLRVKQRGAACRLQAKPEGDDGKNGPCGDASHDAGTQPATDETTGGKGGATAGRRRSPNVRRAATLKR